MTKLQQYPKDEPLRVEFEILDIGKDKDPKENSIRNFYNKKLEGAVINVFYEHEDEENDNPYGYFVMRNV